LSCAALVAGIVEAVMDGSGFVSLLFYGILHSTDERTLTEDPELLAARKSYGSFCTD